MSNEQPRWPAGTPVDAATGAGGGRFAPKSVGSTDWKQAASAAILDKVANNEDMRAAILRIRAMALAEDALDTDPSWRPMMSREEADTWAKGGYFPGDVYHVTNSDRIESIKAIKTMGFRYKGEQYYSYGRVWGDGIYVSTSKEHSDKWFALMALDDTRIERLSIRTNVKNPFVIQVERDEFGKVTTRSVWDNLEEKHPGFSAKVREITEDAYIYSVTFRKQTYASAYDKNELADFPMIGDSSWFALREALRSFGYDSIYVDETEFNVDSAGDQLIVFSPLNLVVVDGKPETWE